MNTQQTNQAAPDESTAYAPCPCREVVDTIRELFGISPAVRQHLTNSRVEFLKAIRQVLDDRIAHISSRTQPGTKVAVE